MSQTCFSVAVILKPIYNSPNCDRVVCGFLNVALRDYVHTRIRLWYQYRSKGHDRD